MFPVRQSCDYYVEKDMARFVTQEEALDIIDKCEEAGLVSQPLPARTREHSATVAGIAVKF